MGCLFARDQDLMDRYIHGRLEESEQQAFEAHLADCEDCAKALKTYGLLRTELSLRRSEIEAHATKTSRALWKLWLPLAALVVLGFGLLFVSLSSTPSELVDLAAFEAPRYEPMQLRSQPDESESRFQEAMKLYSQSDFAGAIYGLERAAESDPSDAASRFFLGICLLKDGQTKAGIEALQQVVALGSTPYIEAAHFYLAKAHLQMGDTGKARSELKAVLDLAGSFQDEAHELLERVPR